MLDYKNEYMIADVQYPNKSSQSITLVPTYRYDTPKIIKLKKPDWTLLDIGTIVKITKPNTIKEIEYNMKKCRTVTLTNVSDTPGIYHTKNVCTKYRYTFIDDGTTPSDGNKCLKIICLNYAPLVDWHVQFFGIAPGHKILVKPHRKTEHDPNSVYKILRDFTIEERVGEFFKRQHKHPSNHILLDIYNTHDLGRYDIVTVVHVRDLPGDWRDVLVVGKEFGLINMVLWYKPEMPWHDVFYDAAPGDELLITPYERNHEYDKDNEYEIRALWRPDSFLRHQLVPRHMGRTHRC